MKSLNKLNKNLNPSKFKITNSKISELNQLLSSRTNNLEDFFIKLNQLLENWKKIYLKYWKNPKEKEKIILLFLENIAKLINNLNVRRVHNSSETLNIANYSFQNLRQLESFFRIRWKDLLSHNKKWFSCHIFNYYIYWLLQELTNKDKDIKYMFEINPKDNHWKLIININWKKYFIDSVEKWIRIEKDEIDKNKKYFKNVKEYTEKSIIWNLNTNTITYQYWRYKLKIYKLWKQTFFSFHTKPIKKLNIHWLKRASKYIQLWIKIRPLGKTKDLKNIENKIFLYIRNKEKREIIKQILSNLEEKWLGKFFN